MNRCLITYNPCEEGRYSSAGLRLISPRLKKLNDFPYSREEQIREAMARADKISIQGVQPKLSVKLNIQNAVFEIVDAGGTYIIKPQHDFYPELPENEDVTMRLAATIGIEVPLHGLIACADGSRSYFIRRFDRLPRGKKVPVEDFAQLSGNTRETKYQFSMERVAGIIDKFCTFPLLEKIKLFRLTIFCFLCGNEDMHLKNFSLIRRNGKVELSPAYDLVNTTIALTTATEELALSLAGKKSKLTFEDMINYFGKERLGLSETVLKDEMECIKRSLPKWLEIIKISFLSDTMKEQYTKLLLSRSRRLGIDTEIST